MRVPTFLSILLLPLSLLYGAILAIRNLCYKQNIFNIYKAPVPVISVGNISMGGTGKTPMAEFLLRKMEENGIKAAYLSRGYGRKTKGYLRVDPYSGDSDDYGDEAFQVAHKFPKIPVAVSENREKGIRELLKENVELIILDDAFQHRKVARDLDLVLIDANRLPAEDRVVPAGTLRESVGGLKRGDMLLINKISYDSQIENISQELSKWQKDLAFMRVEQMEVKAFDPTQEFTEMNLKEEKEVILFSGIGNPDFFQAQIQAAGWKIRKHIKFGDHYDFKGKDIGRLLKEKGERSIFLCTEKDFYRLLNKSFSEKLRGEAFYYIPI
ncbi:MAG: tetraacyldisaccharide 4'-kinase, partial [Bacteroidota bacterium]